jgi:hypothetical protein
MKSDKYTPILEELKAIRGVEEEAESVAAFLARARVSTFDLSEAGGGMARLLRNMSSPFIVITAFRGEYNLEENRKRNGQLMSEIRKHNLGGKAVIGGFTENKGKVNEKDVKEESFFIVWTEKCDLTPEQFRIYGIKLMKRYNQDAILYSDGGTVYSIEVGGKVEALGKSTTTDLSNIGAYWSKIKGRKFAFEGILEPTCVAHAYAMGAMGLYE